MVYFGLVWLISLFEKMAGKIPSGKNIGLKELAGKRPSGEKLVGKKSGGKKT